MLGVKAGALEKNNVLQIINTGVGCVLLSLTATVTIVMAERIARCRNQGMRWCAAGGLAGSGSFCSSCDCWCASRSCSEGCRGLADYACFPARAKSFPVAIGKTATLHEHSCLGS